MTNENVHELSITKILGLQWDEINDTSIFDMKKLETLMIRKPIKTAFIQFFASIYDPLGFINSFVESFVVSSNVGFRKFVFQRLIRIQFFHRTGTGMK